MTPIEKFFDQKLNNFVYKFRIPIAILSVIWFVIATEQALLIGPQTKPEEFVDPESEIMISYTIMINDFDASENNKKSVNLFWGVKGIDRTGENQWDPIFVGVPEWDTSFDPVNVKS